MRGKPTCRVLFVEDEAAVSILIEDMLLDLGVEVVGPASRIEEALDLARTAEIDAAVLDIKLGDTFTYDVADVLRARSIQVIFSTGYGASALPERFQGTPILNKPFDQKTFAQTIASALADSPCEIIPGSGD